MKWPYSAIAGHYDEMLAPSGEIRPHWQTFLDRAGQLGIDEFNKRWNIGQQMIQENGVAYTIYGDNAEADRPWQLDPVPIIISAEEWRKIEAATIQRATLMNQIVADLYGPQTLLKRRLLPPAVIFAQPALLRPLLNVPVPGNVYNHLHAIDLARSPNGQWWVIGDRTQAPSGMGYALENRSVLLRTLPDIIEQCKVSRLAAFFGHLNNTLLSLAPMNRDNPRVILLTPGAYNETYFEHAYLAQFLGYTLAEGRDLTVRDARVYLKTLNGLLPVDVILRRTDDLFCDPLELREDSVLGIPGLLQAVRAGTVAVANALGSGLAQAPAILPYLPGVCRAMLGEELKLPTIATWWCGEAGPMQQVIDNLHRLVIKSSLPGGGEPVFGSTLDAAQRAQLADKIRASPRNWIAQEQVDLSTAPCWSGTDLVPRHAMLRVFVAANADGSYVAMPGGLARVGASRASMVVSMQRGGGSKDTWILTDEPINYANPLPPPGAPVEITRAGQVLPSRVADDMFWLGRYVERLEFGSRIALLIARKAVSDPSSISPLMKLWTRKPDATIDASALETRFVDPLFSRTGQLSWGRSVRADIDRVDRIASNLRDRLPDDAWRAIASLDEQFVKPHIGQSLLLHKTADVLDRAKILVAAFIGQTSDAMSRDKGWAFLDVGRRVERSLHVAELIRWAFIDHEGEHDRLDEALEITSSKRTYRSRYLTTLQRAPVLDLLMLDETNPQSLAFQLVRALFHVESFPIDPQTQLFGDDRRILLKLLTRARLLEVTTLFEDETPDPLHTLAAMLAELKSEMPRFSDVLSRLYLSHARITQQSGRTAQ